MSRVLHDFNVAEAGLWLGLAFFCGVKWLKAGPKMRPPFAILTPALVAFGISDVVEVYSGAWWKPLWLLLLKAGCVALLVWGTFRYYQIRRDHKP